MTDEFRSRVLKLLRNYRLTMTEDEKGNGYPLVDAVTPPGDATITRGIEELEYLAEDISRTIEQLEAENKRLREALEVLENFADTVAPFSSFWEETWPQYQAILAATEQKK